MPNLPLRFQLRGMAPLFTQKSAFLFLFFISWKDMKLPHYCCRSYKKTNTLLSKWKEIKHVSSCMRISNPWRVPWIHKFKGLYKRIYPKSRFNHGRRLWVLLPAPFPFVSPNFMQFYCYHQWLLIVLFYFFPTHWLLTSFFLHHPPL